MEHKNDEKWLDDIISKAADIGRVKFDQESWKSKYLLSESRESSSSYSKLKTQKNIWRIIMESKITRYSAAAVVFLAMTLVLFGPFWVPGNGNVVLAEVQKNVEGVETMIVRGTKTFTHPDQDGKVFEFDGFKGKFDLVKYMSREHGFVEEGYDKGQLVYRLTFNRPTQQTLILLPPWKKYITFPSTDKQEKLLESLSPKGIVKILMAEDYRELGRDTINGVKAEVFEFASTETGSFKGLLPKPIMDIQDYRGKIWIDVKEQMPLKIEADLIMGKSFMTMFNKLNLKEVNTLDQLNVNLDEEIFKIKPPKDYTELTPADILSLIPKEAKAGLFGLTLVPVWFVIRKRRNRKRSTSSRTWQTLSKSD